LRKTILILIIAALYFILRLSTLYSVKPEQLIGGDAGHYYIIAENLLSNGVYAEAGITPSESATWRPPVWPYILSKYMLLSKNFYTLLLIKISIELILILVASFLFLQISNNYLQTLGVAILCVIEPQFLKYSNTMLSENVSALVILITSLLLIYIYNNQNRKLAHYIFGLLSGIILITHPVAIFYVLLLLLSYTWILMTSNSILKFPLVFLLFLTISLAWPLRNEINFKQGYFITASQGATFSKGWNDSVPYLYSNTKSDLADEGLNVKYITKTAAIESYGTLALKKLYTDATIAFLRQADYSLLFHIAVLKIKSNFNPFPETPKPGKLELAGSLFRLIYLFTFLISLLLFILNHSYIRKNNLLFSVTVIMSLVYLAQTIMSVAIYTGLRFNAIYSLLLVCCSFLFWTELWKHRQNLRKNLCE
jgi:hypothetical protein